MDARFAEVERYKRTMNVPLAVRMRPQTLAEYVGRGQAPALATALFPDAKRVFRRRGYFCR